MRRLPYETKECLRCLEDLQQNHSTCFSQFPQNWQQKHLIPSTAQWYSSDAKLCCCYAQMWRTGGKRVRTAHLYWNMWSLLRDDVGILREKLIITHLGALLKAEEVHSPSCIQAKQTIHMKREPATTLTGISHINQSHWSGQLTVGENTNTGHFFLSLWRLAPPKTV